MLLILIFLNRIVQVFIFLSVFSMLFLCLHVFTIYFLFTFSRIINLLGGRIGGGDIDVHELKDQWV